MKILLAKFFLSSLLLGFATPIAVKSKLSMHSKGMILEAQDVEELKGKMAGLREEILEARDDARVQDMASMASMLPVSNEVNWALLAVASTGLVLVFLATVRMS